KRAGEGHDFRLMKGSEACHIYSWSHYRDANAETNYSIFSRLPVICRNADAKTVAAQTAPTCHHAATMPFARSFAGEGKGEGAECRRHRT
ncbi:MAG TPA: hypothetical protein VJ728_04785, partial [Candidatus Binataceae bacterium]|nr:hypothetical protein [Candidatus Binataceae bacterium]